MKKPFCDLCGKEIKARLWIEFQSRETKQVGNFEVQLKGDKPPDLCIGCLRKLLDEVEQKDVGCVAGD